MATITVTETRHIRPRRLSLIGSQQSLLFRLPVELVLKIFEAANLVCKPSVLALVSKSFRRFLYITLYRRVVLDSLRIIQLFHRTVHSTNRTFLADHVKRLVVTWWPESDDSRAQVRDIIAACPGIRALVTPSCRWPVDISRAKSSIEGGISAITVHSFDGDNGTLTRVLRQPLIDVSKTLTHLRFCEPSDMWYSPISMLATFGPLPHLSHLQLARRANANEANDVMFTNSIREFLHSLPALKMLVVSIYPEAFSSTFEPVEDSVIWTRMSEIRSEDGRVVIMPGQYDEWKEGWEDPKLLRSGYYPADFWMSASAVDAA
ncbi:hypothetical protein FPV67DRAFT_1488542 [Lyophyllum atratum]|nr:hypothetical protein FPV67DRAFT_1488542 [Lyophyllum atratum]